MRSSSLRSTVAVIILTYNRYEEFQLALKSVLEQKGVRFHIFVFDNCSDRSIEPFVRHKNITYVRHPRNLGFARNFRIASSTVKKLGYGHTFLLGDDDIIAYDYALRDLYQLLQKHSNTHIARGGFAEFIGKMPNLTRIFTYSNHVINQYANEPETYRAIRFHLGYFSGILYRNELFNSNTSKENDLVTPFVAPLISILKRKKFAFLSNKVTIFTKTQHAQLAIDVYEQPYEVMNGISRSFRMLKMLFTDTTTPSELINYKIYSHNPAYVTGYYEVCLKLNKGKERYIYQLIYITPVFVLSYAKDIIKVLIGLRTKYLLYTKHSYLHLNIIDLLHSIFFLISIEKILFICAFILLCVLGISMMIENYIIQPEQLASWFVVIFALGLIYKLLKLLVLQSSQHE